jgi:hypothetical protein
MLVSSLLLACAGSPDATAPVDGGPGATAIHATVQGIVDPVAGGRARVLATARFTILPDGTRLFDVERVTLTPL